MTDDCPPSFTMSSLLTLVIIAALVGVLSVQAMGMVDNDEMQEYYQQSEQWCNERGGILYNAQVIGSHGGLHCKFNNGTTVHMNEVLESEAV